jgi:transcriptional regulator with XRE-family HTH domain
MVGSGNRGRRKGVAIREGSVAQARSEAGLSLAEVAGGRVSRTAIHLIERGLARPSMETLKLIARQTSKPLSFFLQSREQAFPLNGSMDLQKAKSYLAEALAAGAATREASVQARVCMVMGQLEEWCGNSADADEQFEAAIRILEPLGKSEQLRDAHMAYAELLDGRQDITRAALHWKLAAQIGKLAAIGIDRSHPQVEAAALLSDRPSLTA